MKKNLWILTEERPKNEVIETILKKFIKEQLYILKNRQQVKRVYILQ